jgi:hypothetical protein
MPSKKFLMVGLLLATGLSLCVRAAEKDWKEASTNEPAVPSYKLPQPATETLDYAAYVSIRAEAFGHSHVMEYASALMDGIGSRLTGSTNLKRPTSGHATNLPPWAAATPTLRTGASSAWAGCN